MTMACVEGSLSIFDDRDSNSPDKLSSIWEVMHKLVATWKSPTESHNSLGKRHTISLMRKR